MKKSLLLFGALLLVAYISLAQTKTIDSNKIEIRTPQIPKKETTSSLPSKQMKFSELLDLKAQAIQNREEIKKQIEEAKKEWEQKRQALQQEIQTKREELKAEIENNRKELQNKLQQIRDENKKQAVQKIYQEINNLNIRLTNHYLEVLNKMEKMLENAVERIATLEAKGVDVNNIKSYVQQAENNIQNTRAIIKAQAEKIYPIPNIEQEKELKNEVGKIRQMLHSDLKKVFDEVNKTRESIRKVITLLNSLSNSTTTPPISINPQSTTTNQSPNQ